MAKERAPAAAGSPGLQDLPANWGEGWPPVEDIASHRAVAIATRGDGALPLPVEGSPTSWGTGLATASALPPSREQASVVTTAGSADATAGSGRAGLGSPQPASATEDLVDRAPPAGPWLSMPPAGPRITSPRPLGPHPLEYHCPMYACQYVWTAPPPPPRMYPGQDCPRCGWHTHPRLHAQAAGRPDLRRGTRPG